MLTLQVVLCLAIFGDQDANDASFFADALLPEQIVSLTSKLDDPSFQTREDVSDQLYQFGQSAIYPLELIAQSGSSEASVRAFTILQQLYRSKQETTYEAIEQSLQGLKQSTNVSVAARAQQSIDNNSELRQEHAIAKIEQLGGIVNFRERGLDRQLLSRPQIDYIVLSRGWMGGEAGLQLLGRIEEVRNSEVPLYIIRGVEVSEGSIQNLKAELPFLTVQYRGPARLGVKSQREEHGCFISEIEPGSSAEAAGLKPSDVITEIDHIPIKNFDDLISIIEKKEPGEQIPIVYRRGQEFHETIAELLTWEKKPRSSSVKPKP